MKQRLYKVIVVELPGEGDCTWEPDGWSDYLENEWQPTGQYDDPPLFQWPDEGKVFRSRSAATRALKRFERWGAIAYLAEAEPQWVAVAEANANRKAQRDAVRIAKLEAKIAAIRAAA